MGKSIITLTIPSIGYKKSLTLLIKEENGIIGSDGKAVTYTQNKNGEVIWSKNATEDIKKIGNAMLETEQGKQSLDNWINSETLINIRIDTETPSNKTGGAYAETIPMEDTEGDFIVKNGVFKQVEVVFYQNAITEWRKNSKSRFYEASETEIYGANATHEEGHNRPSQIILDKKYNDERFQKAKKNIPMNIEIKYRDQYNEKRPKNGNPNWKSIYNKNRKLKKFMENYEKQN